MAKLKLTSKQILALQLVKERAIRGESYRYETRWHDGSMTFTAQVKALEKLGLVDTMYFSTGTAAVNLTATGREIA